jgi:hypothetical protein
MANQYWDIPQEWVGETAFIIAGGPSFGMIDAELLRGQHVIAINSSFKAVPFADFIIFADSRWFEHCRMDVEHFKGRIVSCSQSQRDARLLRVARRTRPTDDSRDTLFVQFTTATAAIELAVKLGAAKIVLLGLDGKAAPDGKMHHHKAHPWKSLPGWENKHRMDLIQLVEPLKARGIEICHGTSGSAYEFWPTVALTDLLGHACAAAAA